MSLDDLSSVAEIYGCDGKLNFLCSLDLFPTPLIKNCPNTTKRWLRAVPNLVTHEIGINSGYQELQSSPDTLNFINMTDNGSECSENNLFSSLQNVGDADLGLQNVDQSDFLSNTRSNVDLDEASQSDRNISRMGSSDGILLDDSRPVQTAHPINQPDFVLQDHVGSESTDALSSESPPSADSSVHSSCSSRADANVASIGSHVSNSLSATVFLPASGKSLTQDRSKDSSMPGIASLNTSPICPLSGELTVTNSHVHVSHVPSLPSNKMVSSSSGPFFSNATTESSTAEQPILTSTSLIPVSFAPVISIREDDRLTAFSDAENIRSDPALLSVNQRQVASSTTGVVFSANQIVSLLAYTDSGIITSLIDHQGLAKPPPQQQQGQQQQQLQQQQQEKLHQLQQQQQEKLHQLQQQQQQQKQEHHQKPQQQRQQLSPACFVSLSTKNFSNKSNINSKTSKNCVLLFKDIKEAVFNEILCQEINQTIFAEASIGKTQGYLSELLRSSKHLETKDQKDYCRTRRNLEKIKMFLRKPKQERRRFYDKAKESKLKSQSKDLRTICDKEQGGELFSDHHPVLSCKNGIAAATGDPVRSSKKTRTVISEDAKKYMCEYFTQMMAEKRNLSKDEMQDLASHVDLEVPNVKIFYKNWKQRTKLKN